MTRQYKDFTKIIKDIIPGFVVAILVAGLSMLLAKFIPKLGAASIAIFLGMFVGNVFLNQEIFQKGYKFSETDLLSYSIVLLGATLSISTISEIGISGVIFIVLQMTITIIGALYIGKKLGFSENLRYMMASGMQFVVLLQLQRLHQLLKLMIKKKELP